MFVVMAIGASEGEINGVKSHILGEGLTPHDHAGTERVVIAVVGEIGPRKPVLMSRLEALPGVETVTAISRPFKLTSREFHPEDTVIRVLDATIGDGSLTVMAGPCSIESREQLMETVDGVVAGGATIIRGGAFKPRTSPYSFQGLGVEALRYLAEARERTGLPVITEVMEPNQVDIVAEYADILQIGTRNMQNYSLLTAVGRVARPVMLKRGYGATIEEWLMAAEYIVSSGNPNVILCERGIRTFETYTRNTLDLAAVPLLHHLTHLPVIVDPSHATGKRWLIKPMSLAAVAAGADGVMVEVHPRPDEALSDGEQSITIEQFGELMTGAPADPRAGPRSPRRPGPVRGGAEGRRREQALSGRPAVAEDRRRRDDRAGGHRAGVPAARRAGAARRQVDQPPGPAAGRPGRRREPDRGRRRRRGRPDDGGPDRASRGRCRAGRRRWPDGLVPGRVAGDRRAPRSRRRARLPELGDDPAPDGRVLAGLPATHVLDGDGSLRRRPVARIIEPLRSMGAVLHARRNDSLPPLTVVGHTPLRAIDFSTVVPSAQVKSAILLAGLRADGRTTVREAIATRDHTERMLRARGVPVTREAVEGGLGAAWSVEGGIRVRAVSERVPADVSAAAFWLVAGAIHPDAELTLRRVGTNPTRRAIIDLLRRMGARIDEVAPGRVGPRAATTGSASRWRT